MSIDLALGQIWADSVKKRQSYGIFSVFGDGAGGQPSGRRIGAISSFLSIDTLGRSQSYGIFTVFGGAAGGAAGGPLPVVGSAQNFSPTFSIPQGCLTKNFSPIG